MPPRDAVRRGEVEYGGARGNSLGAALISSFLSGLGRTGNLELCRFGASAILLGCAESVHRRSPEKGAHVMSKEGKHHYIPVFYLKQWAGPDRRICEFSKPYDRVTARRVFPDATAYVHGLNRIPGLPPHEADFLESYFFKLTDDLGAKALQILLSGAPTLNFSPKIKSGWSRFIASLMMRNPEMVQRSVLAAKALYEQSLAELQGDYAKHRNPTDPPTYEEYAALRSPNTAGRGGAILLQKIIDNPDLGNRINNKRWTVLKAQSPELTLLTSDRPVLITNGLAYEHSQLILPISPFHVFFAVDTADTERYIEHVFAKGQMIQQVNERVALQARKYVYGLSDVHFNFVATRLGKKYTATPLDEMTLPMPGASPSSKK